MKKWMLLMLLAVNSGFSQTAGIVIDSLSGKPVAFASIAVENEKKGITAEENGRFILEGISGNETLLVSALGFESKTVKAEKNLEIKLNPIIIRLPQISIANKHHPEKRTIGGYEKEWGYQPGFGWPTLFAKKFPFEPAYTRTPFIEKAILYLDNSHRKATIKVRVFEVGEDGFPGKDLVQEDIILTVKRGTHKMDVDFSQYHLEMPENGIFVAVEWLLVESNRYTETYKDSQGKRHKATLYEPAIFTDRKESRNAYFREGGNKWYERPLMTGDRTVVGSAEPAINLILTN